MLTIDEHDVMEIVMHFCKLLDFCTSGRRYETCNPYSIPEIEAALKTWARVMERPDWLGQTPRDDAEAIRQGLEDDALEVRVTPAKITKQADALDQLDREVACVEVVQAQAAKYREKVARIALAYRAGPALLRRLGVSEDDIQKAEAKSRRGPTLFPIRSERSPQ